MTQRLPERRLPCHIEAEQAVLGSLLLDPEALLQVADVLEPADFYREAHRLIYAAMLHLFHQRTPADFLTVCDELERRHQLDAVDGPSYITSLVNMVPSSANVLTYAQIVQSKAQYRRLIQAASQIAAWAYEETPDALERAEQCLFAIRRHHAAGLTPLATVLADCLQDIDRIREQRGTLIGIPTGFHTLDQALGGWQRGDLIVIAARPGTGKTSFALSVVAHALDVHHLRVAFFSLEMERKHLGLRLLAMTTHMDQQRLRSGWIHNDEWDHLLATVKRLGARSLWIEDTAALSLPTLRSLARRAQAQQGIDLLVVDYLQLLQASQHGKRFATREQEIAEISRELKTIAKELHVPVLALAQVSRAVENRASKVPQLSDLRESGAIENDADVVLFIYRDELYNPQSEARGTADLLIAKHRNGAIGTVRVGFEPSQTRFYDLNL